MSAQNWVHDGVNVRDGDGALIVTAWMRPTSDDREAGESWLEMRDRTQAERDAKQAETLERARLMAAAPELLAACIAFLASDSVDLSVIVGRDLDGHPLNAAGAARIFMRSAIAKATGAAA